MWLKLLNLPFGGKLRSKSITLDNSRLSWEEQPTSGVDLDGKSKRFTISDGIEFKPRCPCLRCCDGCVAELLMTEFCLEQSMPNGPWMFGDMFSTSTLRWEPSSTKASRNCKLWTLEYRVGMLWPISDKTRRGLTFLTSARSREVPLRRCLRSFESILILYIFIQ